MAHALSWDALSAAGVCVRTGDFVRVPPRAWRLEIPWIEHPLPPFERAWHGLTVMTDRYLGREVRPVVADADLAKWLGAARDGAPFEPEPPEVFPAEKRNSGARTTEAREAAAAETGAEPTGPRPQGTTDADHLPDGATTYRTGVPGRPTSRHLVDAEFGRRMAAGEVLPTLKAEAEWLAAWLARAHPGAAAMSQTTTQNLIRHRYSRMPKKGP